MKLFHRSPVTRRCGELFQFPTLVRTYSGLSFPLEWGVEWSGVLLLLHFLLLREGSLGGLGQEWTDDMTAGLLKTSVGRKRGIEDTSSVPGWTLPHYFDV